MDTMLPKVQEWLEKQGYSLEMRAASAFRAVGLEVRQSSYYIDLETGKPREMDVQACSASPRGFVDVRFFVECKSGDKPWVLLCSTDTLTNYDRLMAFGAMSKQAREAFSRTEKLQVLLQRFPWLKKDGVVAAYSLRQAFSGDADIAYAAAMNVCKACQSHVTESHRTIRYFNFAFPIIAVDMPLIRCVLDLQGGMALEEVQEGEFLFSGHSLGTCIRVVSLTRLKDFASEAKQVAWRLQAELQVEEEQAFKQLEKRVNQRGV